MTILHHAARSANVSAVDYFIRAFPPLIEMRDIFNRTPLDALLNEREVESILCLFDEDIRLPDWSYVTCIGLLSGTEIYQPLSLEDLDHPIDTMTHHEDYGCQVPEDYDVNPSNCIWLYLWPLQLRYNKPKNVLPIASSCQEGLHHLLQHFLACLWEV